MIHSYAHNLPEGVIKDKQLRRIHRSWLKLEKHIVYKLYRNNTVHTINFKDLDTKQ